MYSTKIEFYMLVKSSSASILRVCKAAKSQPEPLLLDNRIKTEISYAGSYRMHFVVCWFFFSKFFFNFLQDTIRPRRYKTFLCSTQLSAKFILLINIKMPTIVGILTFISMINTTSERLKAKLTSYLLVFEFL